MKIRAGFVSNSSSSNFIVAFPKGKLSVDKVRDLLFGDQKMLYHYEYHVDTLTVADAVYGDIKGKGKATLKDIEEVFNSGTLAGDPDYNKYETIDQRTDWDRYEADTKKNRDKIREKFMRENKDKVFYIFGYSDNDGDFNSALEHGGVFDKLNHIQFSCH